MGRRSGADRGRWLGLAPPTADREDPIVASLIRRRSVLAAALLAPLAAACGTAGTPGAPAATDPWADLDGQLRTLADQGQFSGAVRAGQGDRPLLDAGYGAAD